MCPRRCIGTICRWPSPAWRAGRAVAAKSVQPGSVAMPKSDANADWHRGSRLADPTVGFGSLISNDELEFRRVLDALPAAIYTTDAKGCITHFNPACVEFSGRTPELGSDHWCVTWKLFHPNGTPLPHDKCPMAVSLREQRSVRGAEAIAEQPDGSRIWFEPYPTPLFNSVGNLVGGI